MKKFRVYVVGAATFLTIEHSAETAEDLFSMAHHAGFLSAAAVERNGRRRNVLIPFGSIALIAEGEEHGLRMRQAVPAAARKLS